MFNSKKQESQTANSNSPASAGTNSIVAGTKIEGELIANSDIRIDGEIVGKLQCSGKVIIGDKGKFQGDIQCVNAVIEGSFTGKLFVKELLNVRETAKINGEINTNKLIVQSGAIFNVNCTMGGQSLNKENKKTEEPVINLSKS